MPDLFFISCFRPERKSNHFESTCPAGPTQLDMAAEILLVYFCHPLNGVQTRNWLNPHPG